MGDEAESGSVGALEGRGHRRGGSVEQSPLQVRASFFKNRSWELVVSLNRAVCERGRAQHGQNSESYAALEKEWQLTQTDTQSLEEAFDFLRSCHRKAPFLAFNGNTFADIGRTLADVIFSELPTTRRRQVISAVAHYIAGVLPKEAMAEIIESLCSTAEWKIGDRVKTLMGTMRGKIIKILGDGRIVWKADGSGAELVALPETLVLEAKPSA